ncbi:MAG TPA: hypothetical protein VMR21_00415 [Vicinamibacteria bacterium]|nr:hypothetical protein [Vicinamibacteria bacterium]
MDTFLRDLGLAMRLLRRRRGFTALALAGIAAGLVAAALAAGVLEGLLFQVPPRDPGSLAAVSVLLLLATLAAAWVPARRASRVDPIKALRAE